jgi:hypothetical protein
MSCGARITRGPQTGPQGTLVVRSAGRAAPMLWAWGAFYIGALLAFAGAVMSAAASRWVGGIGYLVVLLLFVPVGISSSGTTLGPHMITPWYADLGKALPPGTAQPAIRNVTYFSGNAIIDPLLVLSGWALAGVIALVLAAVLHPPARQPGQKPAASQRAPVAPQTRSTARAV